MFVFLHGDGARPPPETLLMFITPAAHLEGTGEMPRGWLDSKKNPQSFQVQFTHGRAEVDDELGRYLITQQLAHKSSSQLFRP